MCGTVGVAEHGGQRGAGPGEPVGDGPAQSRPVFQQALRHLRVAGGVHQEVGLDQQPVPVEQQYAGDPVHGGGHVEIRSVLGEGAGDLLGDEVGPLAVEREEQLVQAGEVGVEGAPAVSGGLADLLDGDPAEALGREHGERRGEEVGPGADPAPGDAPLLARCRHAPTSVRYENVSDTAMYPKTSGAANLRRPPTGVERTFD